MKIVVVEPHPDDAFLSLGHHLEKVWADRERVIVTVYHDARRGREAAEYAAAVGASWVGLGLAETEMLAREQKVRAVPDLRELLAGPEYVGASVLFPLGLQHPDHLRVAATRTPGALRYVDTPYQTKQKLAETLLDRAGGMILESLAYPGARKWRHAAVFKSQAKFFHFNAGLKESLLPEMVLRPTPVPPDAG